MKEKVQDDSRVVVQEKWVPLSIKLFIETTTREPRPERILHLQKVFLDDEYSIEGIITYYIIICIIFFVSQNSKCRFDSNICRKSLIWKYLPSVPQRQWGCSPIAKQRRNSLSYFSKVTKKEGNFSFIFQYESTPSLFLFSYINLKELNAT